MTKKNVLFLSEISKSEYDNQQAWGLLAIINLYDCNPTLIKSPKVIKKFIIELCKVIKMKRFGEPIIERFAQGPLEGYSVMQFIETSSITIHFDEERNRVFLDIFSCQFFHSDKAAKFSKKFFKAKEYKIHAIIRN